ncbi:unnamed protein product [Trichobilharzia regenti]|nr:unnamed protein product [Trichobilharzia regenti]
MKNSDRNRLDSGETDHVLIKSPHYGSSLNTAWNDSHFFISNSSALKRHSTASPMIVLIAGGGLDNATDNGPESEETGIKWTYTKNLEDLDFADDVCLISHKLGDMQMKSNKLSEESSKIGRQVNIEKTELTNIPDKQQQ